MEKAHGSEKEREKIVKIIIMPFTSKAQRAWMYANKPEMAKRWEKETPNYVLKRLPNRSKDGKY
jgi:hypothetical protein